MEYKFFDLKKIKEWYENENINQDELYIGSVAEHLEFTEYLKKSAPSLPNSIEELFKKIMGEKIIWVELDTGLFASNAFNDDFDNLAFKQEIEDSTTKPTYTCNLVNLRPNEREAFWDNDVFSQMLEYYG
jgi:hypothetical protein